MPESLRSQLAVATIDQDEAALRDAVFAMGLHETGHLLDGLHSPGAVAWLCRQPASTVRFVACLAGVMLSRLSAGVIAGELDGESGPGGVE
jgi:hypothetical protein